MQRRIISNGRINFVISSVHVDKLTLILKNWKVKLKRIELFGVCNCSLNYL